MNLKDTVNLMTSNDYKERFIAEYMQLDIRFNELLLIIAKYEKGFLDFTPTCSQGLLSNQLQAMKYYRDALRERAIIEKIDLKI